MAKASAFDFAQTTEKLLGALNVDTKAYEDVLKNAAEFNAKLGKVAVDAAKKNAELTNAWTQDVLARFDNANTACGNPVEYAAAASDFATAEARALPERLAQFAEVAKTAQLNTVDLLISAGKTVQEKAAPVAATAKPGK